MSNLGTKHSNIVLEKTVRRLEKILTELEKEIVLLKDRIKALGG